MNCKPGDIAMITSPRNYGRLVEVVKLASRSGVRGPIWSVRALQTIENREGILRKPGSVGRCHDVYLKPFQPPPEEDITENEKELETT